MTTATDIPIGASRHDRLAFREWVRRGAISGRPGRTWDEWQEMRRGRGEYLRDSLDRVRNVKGHGNTVTPPGTPKRLQKQFAKFKHDHGRCTFGAWYDWVTLKGPHPLRYL